MKYLWAAAVLVFLPGTLLWIYAGRRTQINPVPRSAGLWIALTNFLPVLFVGVNIARVQPTGSGSFLWAVLLISGSMLISCGFFYAVLSVIEERSSPTAGLFELMVRLTFLVVLPCGIAVVLLGGTLANATVKAWLELHPSLGFAVAIAFMFGFAALYPVFRLMSWRGKSLEPGPLRNKLMSLAAVSGVKVEDVIIGPSKRQSPMVALADGVLPRRGWVFLPETYLSDYTERELVAIFGHELGHIRLGHLWQKALLFVTSGAIFGLVVWVSDPFIVVTPLTVAIRAALVWTVLSLPLSYFSRQMEFTADRFAARVTQDIDALISALGRTVGIPSVEDSWPEWWRSYPTPHLRIRRLKDLSR